MHLNAWRAVRSGYDHLKARKSSRSKVTWFRYFYDGHIGFQTLVHLGFVSNLNVTVRSTITWRPENPQGQSQRSTNWLITICSHLGFHTAAIAPPLASLKQVASFARPKLRCLKRHPDYSFSNIWRQDNHVVSFLSHFDKENPKMFDFVGPWRHTYKNLVFFSVNVGSIP